MFVFTLVFNVLIFENLSKVYNHKYFSLLSCLLGFGILLEILIRKQNKKLKKLSPKYIVPPSSRLFTLIAYSAFFLEVNRLYYYTGKRIIDNFCGSTLQHIIWIFYSWYDIIPGNIRTMVLFIAYYVFLYGIARNRERFDYFTRYHYAQALLLGTCSTFMYRVSLIIQEFCMNFLVSELVAFFIYAFFSFLTLLCLISVVLGTESNLILLHQSILYNVGVKPTQTSKSSNINNKNKERKK